MQLFAILYEDDELLVVNKLVPIPVQPDKTGAPSLQELVKAEIAARPGAAGAFFLEAAHRIDRRASGAVIFAKTAKALSTVEAAFRGRRVEKEYIACVEREPVPEAGKLEHRLVWDKRRNVVRAAAIGAGENELARLDAAARGDTGNKGKPKTAPEKAVLDYRLVGRSERYFFVEVTLHTGRHHQIRAQFSAAGFPIRGDLKYGARRSAPNGLIMLHARRLEVPQPKTGLVVEVLAPFPATEPLWAAFGAPPGGTDRPEGGSAPA